MGPGGADTLSADPKELATEAGNAQDCAAKSQRMRTEDTAGSISGKISGGKAASTVKTTSEHLSNELKDIEHQLSDYSDDLVATMKTIEQTDQNEAGMYQGMTPSGDAGGFAEGIGAGAGDGGAGDAGGGSGAAIGGGHSYGSAGGASGGSAGGGHSYGSANGGAGQLFGSPGGGSVVGGHSYGSTESGQIVGSHGGHHSMGGALGGIHNLMSGDSDSFSSGAGGSHPAPMPRVETSGDPAPMPHAAPSGDPVAMPQAETPGNPAPMPRIEPSDPPVFTRGGGADYGPRIPGVGADGGSFAPSPMPHVENPGNAVPLPGAQGSDAPAPMPRVHGSGGSSSAVTA